MIHSLPIRGDQTHLKNGANQSEAHDAAKQLEATFLAEMFKSAGFGEQENSFSGSTGEDQFASFQRQALAEQLVERGGIGLAEAFYQAIMEKQNGV